MKNSLEEQLSSLQHSPASEPDPQWVASLRSKMEWTMARRGAPSYTPVTHIGKLAWFKRPFTAALLSLAVLLLISGGVTYAAQGAVPGNPLYPVKLASEEMRLKLASSDIVRTELELTLASRRMEEFRVLSAQDKITPETAANISARYEAHVSAALIALPTLPQDAVPGITETISHTIDAHIETSAAWEQNREEVDKNADRMQAGDAAREPLRQRREEVRKQIDRMREFARETRNAAKLLKESRSEEVKLKIKVETDDDGRAHVKIEAEQKNKKKEKKNKIEFTVPLNASTSSVEMFWSSDDEDKKMNEDATSATTTIFYDSRAVYPPSFPTSTLRYYYPGAQINTKMESSGEGSVSQEIKSEITSESKMEFKSKSNSGDNEDDDDSP